MLSRDTSLVFQRKLRTRVYFRRCRQEACTSKEVSQPLRRPCSALHAADFCHRTFDSYVDALENRMERMEKLLASLAPGVDFSDKIGKPIRRPDDNRGPDDSATAQQTLSLPGSPNKEPGLGLEHGSVFSEQCMANKDLCPSAAGGAGRGEGVVGTDDEEEVAFLENSFGRTSLWDDGRLEAEKGSDLARALQEVVPEAVAAYSSQESEQSSATPAQGTEGLARNSKSFVGKASGFHLITQLERLSAARADEQREFVLQGIRPQYWAFPSGFEELPPRLELIDLCWPVPELEQSLVDAYFARVHSEYPVVNEVVFRDELKNHPELRKSHDWLGVAMGIFAIGSRFIDDPRVLLPSKDPLRHTAGLPYWNVKKKLGIRIFTTSSLHQLQSMVLGVVFLLGTPLAATSAWSILGATVRLLQDAGAHRQVTAKRTQLDVVEKETRKRLFWICYSIDRELSAGLGRPMCIQDEDFDLDEPLQVDDEHICEARESGKLPVQPADKPSRFSGFVIALRLSQINGRTLRTIYAIGKAKVTRGFIGPQWDQFIVAEVSGPASVGSLPSETMRVRAQGIADVTFATVYLAQIDSALNQWLDTVPDHLRYNPHETNDEWLIQSSLLHTKYYQSQVSPAL